MGNLQSTPRNQALGRIADILKQGKGAANQYAMKDWVPLVGGTGLGDMFMGKAPELVDDISYDGLQAAIRGGNAATGGIGTYGARPAVADAALLGMDAAGLTKGLGALAKGGGRAAMNHLTGGATEASRREFMKKAGALAGSAATAGTGMGLLRKFGDNAVLDVAPKVADNFVAATIKSPYRYNSLAEYIAGVQSRVAKGEHELLQLPDDVYIDTQEDAMKHLLKADADNYAEVKNMFGGSPENWENSYQKNILSPQAKQEMKELKGNVAKLHSDYGMNPESDWTQWIANSQDINQTNQILKDMQLNINPME